MTKSDSQVSFNLVYDGPSLENGEINVSDLGSSLVALGTLFNRSSAILNENNSSIDIKVKALSKGSFDVSLLINQSTIDKAINFFSGNEVTALNNLMGLLGFTGTTALGLFGLIKLARNRRIKSAKESSGKVEITFEDNSTVSVVNNVYVFYQDTDLRRAVEQVTKPLSRDGVDSLEMYVDGKMGHSVSKDELAYYEYAAEKQDLGETIQTIYVTLEMINFKLGKCKINDGVKSFHASIKDEAFQKKVDSGVISFAVNDVFQVRLKIAQALSGGELKANYEIIEVLSHKQAAKQIGFDI